MRLGESTSEGAAKVSHHVAWLLRRIRPGMELCSFDRRLVGRIGRVEGSSVVVNSGARRLRVCANALLAGDGETVFLTCYHHRLGAYVHEDEPSG
jgi:hypothetical protein